MLDYKEYICAISEEKSFSRAAQKLYVSQPWLSSVVKKVEQEIKIPLFDRSTTPISLTPAGEYYVEQARKVMAIEDEMRRHFQELSMKTDEGLNIGSSMFFCTYVLPNLLQEFRAMNPQITLTFTEGDSQTLLGKLLEQKIDFILEAEALKGPKIQSTAWAVEEIVLAVPSAFPINRELQDYCYSFSEFQNRKSQGIEKPPVPLSAFREQPFLLLSQGNDLYQRSIELCRHAGFAPKVSMYLTQMMTVYYLICEGQGVSFLRSAICEYAPPAEGVVFYQLDDPAAVRNIYLSQRRQEPDVRQQKLLDYLWSRSLLQR